MILGIGSDLVDIRRIEQTIARYGDRLSSVSSRRLNGLRPLRTRQSVPTYAKRFAAKEACAKALGTGIRRGVFFKDMGVVNEPSGQPTHGIYRWCACAARGYDPEGTEIRIHLRITDENDWAQAFVVIEAVNHSRHLIIDLIASDIP